MGRHVIGALRGMGIERVVLGHEPTQPGLEIARRLGVGIFLHEKAGGRVRDEDGAKTFGTPGAGDDLVDAAGDLVQSGTRKLDMQTLDGRHRSQT